LKGRGVQTPQTGKMGLCWGKKNGAKASDKSSKSADLWRGGNPPRKERTAPSQGKKGKEHVKFPIKLWEKVLAELVEKKAYQYGRVKTKTATEKRMVKKWPTTKKDFRLTKGFTFTRGKTGGNRRHLIYRNGRGKRGEGKRKEKKGKGREKSIGAGKPRWRPMHSSDIHTVLGRGEDADGKSRTEK